MKVLFVRIAQRLKRVALWIGKKQTILIYALLYMLVIGPVALIHRVFADPFQHRKRRAFNLLDSASDHRGNP